MSKRTRHIIQNLQLCILLAVLVACAAKPILKEPILDLADGSTFDAGSLCSVAGATSEYIRANKSDLYANHIGSAAALNKAFPELQETDIDAGRVQATLKFICEVHDEDLRAGRVSRLHDPEFLQTHFDFYMWHPDKQVANNIAQSSDNFKKTNILENIPSDQILLTKYYVKKLKGSPVETPVFSQALYGLPYDEQGLSVEEAEAVQSTLTRLQYRRSEIIDGALKRKQLAPPLIWLSEEALHDVLLQGTGVIDDGRRTRYFNVHRNNDIDYDYSIGKREQERYWYFAEVNSVLGYGDAIDNKIPLKKNVSVAGNVEQLGLGKLFFIQYGSDIDARKHLAILSDEGGAFKNNLFQLDLLVGEYYGWSDYYEDYKTVPDYARVWLMLKKR